MTQTSIIQPGHINTLPTSDVGPYSADEWAGMYRTLFTRNQSVAQGVIAQYLNELIVTEAPANQLNVDTGGGVVAGHWFQNDATLAFTPAAPAANPRIDVIVMCENNTAIQRTVGIATANNLIFPTSLVDYAASASIEPFTARLVILPGNEAGAPVVPTLDVDTATLFMVPIAQYQIAVGGAVTALTDLRTPANTPTGTWVKLEDQLLAAVASPITFSAITQLFTHLKLVLYMQSDEAGTVADGAYMQFNADVGNNYDSNWWSADPAVATSIVNLAQPWAFLGEFTTQLAANRNVADCYEVLIADYTNVNFEHTLRSQGGTIPNATANDIEQQTTYSRWRNVGPITQIDIHVSGAADFAIGSRFSLYGIM